MKIFFEPNRGPNNNTIPYTMIVEIGASELDWERTFRIPVLLSHGIIYLVEACGLQVKASTLKELGPMAQSLMLTLEYMSRLPTYVFITRRSRKVLPVYTLGDKVIANTQQGVSFQHIELAKVREYVTDYLQQIGDLGPFERGDKLHVRGVDKERLSLIRPAFYLKKRAMLGRENEFWAPVFYSQDDDQTIFAYAASTKHQAKINQGQEVFELRDKVAQALIKNDRLQVNYNLRADRLMPEHWQQVKSILTALPRKLTYEGIKLPLYAGDDFLVALEYRSAEDRYSLFLGENDEDLHNRVAQDLIRRDFITSPQAVYFEDE
jgi:hypothetical protein